MNKRSGLVFGVIGLIVAAIVVIAVTASGGSSSTRSSSGSQRAAAAPTTLPPTTLPAAPVTAAPAPPAPAGAVVHVAHDAKLGDILVSGAGRTAYVLDREMGTVSACTGTCTMNWPVWATAAAPTGGPGVDATLLGSAHGQVTYAGHLLYFFAGDTQPGTANGVGLGGFHAVSPGGMQVG